MPADEAEDDTARLSELIALAEAGLQAEEDDDEFFTQAVEATDEVEAAYYRRKADRGNAGEPLFVSLNWCYVRTQHRAITLSHTSCFL